MMDEVPSTSQLLHLRPRSQNTQRVWCIGKERGWPFRDSDLRLAVLPDRHENFASLRSIIAQLTYYAQPEHLSQLTKLNIYLNQVCVDPAANGADAVGKFLADSVTFAIMRRISRESVYSARIIELGAQVINAILSQVHNCEQVHVEHIDRLDRPTLKVLARAMLLLEPTHEFSWVWHSESNPASGCASKSEDLFLTSRNQLLRQMIGILTPILKRHPDATSLTRPAVRPRSMSLYDISAALVIQNYDACFLARCA
jgi:hypothetical protein